MIEIDGAFGEGGGQVLRTALTLSVLTQQDISITDVRAGRKKPGLNPQHLKAVEATVAICDGRVEGANLGSQIIRLWPGEITPGSYRFDIGTAGATSLLLQTIVLPLTATGKQSKVVITGGTHVPWSPCFHYLDQHWLKFLSQMGFNLQITLEKAGFYPQGGGQVRADIHTSKDISPICILERGKLIQIRGISAVANLPRQIAERQRNRILSRIGHKYPLNDLRITNLPSRFKGTMLLLIAEFEKTQACYFSLGALGKPAEKVADEAVDSLEQFMISDGSIDQYLADQLLLPMVFSKGWSEFRTSKVTQHLMTNAAIIQQFLPIEILIDGKIGNPGRVMVRP